MQVWAVMWLLLPVALAQEQQRSHVDLAGMLDPGGVVGKLSEGLQSAGRLLGLHIADTVADLVSSAFGRPASHRGDAGAGAGAGAGPLRRTPPYTPPPPPPSMLSGILRLLGLDSSKLGAIALNGIIFLAQLISSSLATRPVLSSSRIHEEDQQRWGQQPAGSPLSWVLNNPQIKGSAALQAAQDPSLPDRLIQDIQRRFPRQARSVGGGHGGGHGGDTGCVQLLVCKAAPFVRGMQRSLARALLPASQHPHRSRGRGDAGAEQEDGAARVTRAARAGLTLTPVQRMFENMPTAAEVLDNATACVQRFSTCKIMY